MNGRTVVLCLIFAQIAIDQTYFVHSLCFLSIKYKLFQFTAILKVWASSHPAFLYVHEVVLPMCTAAQLRQGFGATDKPKNFLCKSSSRTFLQIPPPQLAFSQRASPAEASGVLLTHSTTPEMEISFLSVG